MTAAELGELHRQDTEYIRAAESVGGPRDDLLRRYQTVRDATAAMAAPLAVEDQVIQTMPDVSPTKWHLGHTSWFFEQFLLTDGPAADPAYRPFHDRFAYIFNSYYVTVGDRHCRIKRGTLSRPTVAEVADYRRHVDAAMARLIASADDAGLRATAPLVEIGLNHEQQHQELAYTDVKHVFACNPLYPAYDTAKTPATPAKARPERFVRIAGGLHDVGHGGGGFSYDNERPRHAVHLRDFAISDRLVTNGEYLDFIESGGYREAQHWLSDGWSKVCSDPADWSQPLYWHRGGDGRWREFTLHGLVELDLAAPACHLSYFEADAYAKWRGLRLPTEAEWEVAAAALGADHASGNFQEDRTFHPRPAIQGNQLLGDCWEWTGSQYTAYPGYRPPAGALGEYNGKFMCNQFVLRGGSCVTPRSHARTTYRNFFPPDARWQFTGLRLARDI